MFQTKMKNFIMQDIFSSKIYINLLFVGLQICRLKKISGISEQLLFLLMDHTFTYTLYGSQFEYNSFMNNNFTHAKIKMQYIWEKQYKIVNSVILILTRISVLYSEQFQKL